jgi:hypothetical protein
MIGIVYTVAAVMRVITAAFHIYQAIIMATTIAHARNAAAITGETAATWGLVSAKAALMSLSGPVGLALLAAAGAAALGYGLQTGMIKGFQQGGVVPETGIYALHKGETVIPAGTNFNQIFINMTTGPISSSVDVDNMLDNMALRMAKESRRRLGR